MLFRVLGPIQVCDEAGGPRQIGARKLRLLLAVMLSHAGARVATSRLVDVLWDGNPPRSATANLQTYVWDLRRRLPATRLGEPRIEWDRDGYRMPVQQGELDALSFNKLAEHGRRELGAGHIARGAEILSVALGLWRGQPYEDVAPQAVALSAARLVELHRLAQEDLLDARLHLGEHREVVDDLRVLTTTEPLRERPWAQLMLALHRCGRRAEALYAYQEVYRLLDAELGIQPGLPLRELHHRILHDDPALDHETALGQRVSA